MAISGDVFRINQVYELLQKDKWPTAPNIIYGWFGGGSPPGSGSGSIGISTIDRINFNSDTETASVRGPLSYARGDSAGVANQTQAWFGGGYSSGQQRVDRVDFIDDTVTASNRTSLPLPGARGLGAVGNLTHGYFVGGGSVNFNSQYSTIQRFTFTDDTSYSNRGSLTKGKSRFGTIGNSIYAWFSGGAFGSATWGNQGDRITFSSDTVTASSRGNLSVGRFNVSATGNANFGWFSGGGTPGTPGHFSRIDRLDLNNDTVNATVRGPLSLARNRTGATGSTSYGYVAGGFNNSGGPWIAYSTVDRIDFSADTGTASVRGPLSLSRYTPAGVSAYKF